MALASRVPERPNGCGGIGGCEGGEPGSPASPETPIIRSFAAKNGASVS
jgi:hypothetical protein